MTFYKNRTITIYNFYFGEVLKRSQLHGSFFRGIPKLIPMSTSKVLRALEINGIIQRQEHATNTRAKMGVLTINGMDLIKEAIKQWRILTINFFHGLTLN